jgi:hypothetical protein
MKFGDDKTLKEYENQRKPDTKKSNGTFTDFNHLICKAMVLENMVICQVFLCLLTIDLLIFILI